MSKSIMQARRECYICREKYNVLNERGLEEHHVLNGPLRSFSEQYGLKVWLCHRLQSGLYPWLEIRPAGAGGRLGQAGQHHQVFQML